MIIYLSHLPKHLLILLNVMITIHGRLMPSYITSKMFLFIIQHWCGRSCHKGLRIFICIESLCNWSLRVLRTTCFCVLNMPYGKKSQQKRPISMICFPLKDKNFLQESIDFNFQCLISQHCNKNLVFNTYYKIFINFFPSVLSDVINDYSMHLKGNRHLFGKKNVEIFFDFFTRYENFSCEAWFEHKKETMYRTLSAKYVQDFFFQNWKSISTSR